MLTGSIPAHTPSHFSAGFTLVEVMVGLAILGLLLGLGLPALSNAMANAKLRSVVSTFHAAAQFARTEAIRRNGGVEIVLTDDAPTTANKDTANLSTSGKNWIVRSLVAGSTDTYTLLQGKSAHEGGATSVVVTGTSNRVAFNGLGASTAGVARFAFTSNQGACADVNGAGPIRCLDVRISATGQTRLCDPVITTAGDSRACN